MGRRRSEPRGELVLVLDGAPPPPAVDAERIEAALGRRLDDGASARDAAATVAHALGVPKRRAYELAVQLPRPRRDVGYRSAVVGRRRLGPARLDLLVDQVEHHAGQPGGSRLAEVDAVLLAEVDQVAARVGLALDVLAVVVAEDRVRCRGRSSTAGSRPLRGRCRS